MVGKPAPLGAFGVRDSRYSPFMFSWFDTTAAFTNAATQTDMEGEDGEVDEHSRADGAKINGKTNVRKPKSRGLSSGTAAAWL